MELKYQKSRYDPFSHLSSSAQVEAEQEAEQRQMLLRKLTEVDSVCQRQQKHIEDKSKLLQETSQALAAAQDQNKALISLQASLEHTRGHLQREVHKKEGEINRLQVGIFGGPWINQHDCML